MEYITSNNIEGKKAKELLREHEKKCEKYLTARKNKNPSDDYYSAGGLTRDSVLVVRTQALIDLQESLSSEESSAEANLGTQADTPFLDTSHSFYANELRIAVEAWTELYEKNPPSMSLKVATKNISLNGLKKSFQV